MTFTSWRDGGGGLQSPHLITLAPSHPWSSLHLPRAPGAGAGALPTLGGLQEAGESKTRRTRNGNVIAQPLEQRPWQELCCGRSVSLLPASRDTRAVPKVTRAAFATHKGIQSLPAGRNCCIPSSASGLGLGVSLLPADVALWSPRLGVIPIPSPLSLGCSSLPWLGWLSVDAVGSLWLQWSRDGTQDRPRWQTLGERPGTAELALLFSPEMCHLFEQMNKSEFLHFMQLW